MFPCARNAGHAPRRSARAQQQEIALKERQDQADRDEPSVFSIGARDLPGLLGLHCAFVATVAGAAGSPGGRLAVAAGLGALPAAVGALAWLVRGDEPMFRLRAWWQERRMLRDPVIAARTEASARDGAVARLLDGGRGVYLVSRGDGERYDVMGPGAFAKFRAQTARAGGILTLVAVDEGNREVTVSRFQGGLLHGPSADCPAVSRFRGGHEQCWYFDHGRNVTERIVRTAHLQEACLPARAGP
jgi:hypothetical protein